MSRRSPTWIDRNAAYDAALRRLYEALLDSKGQVTDHVRAAFDGEQAARRELPPDTRGLVVIMSDIAQGGLNQAVIAIEEARGALASAIDLPAAAAGAARPRPSRPRHRVRRRRYTGAPNSQPRPAAGGRRPGCPPEDPVRADPRCHRPAVGGLDRRAGRARRRRARVHRRLDELDRRSGGELRRCQAFGELRDRATGRRSRRAGELPARRVAGRLGRSCRGPRPRDGAQVRRPARSGA